MVKDFCGTVTEDSMRANILLVFEVLCEAMVRPEAMVWPKASGYGKAKGQRLW